MLSPEEYEDIYAQLAQMLLSIGRKDIVTDVYAQITELDAIPAKKWVEAEEHFRPQPQQTAQKRSKRLPNQPHLFSLEPEPPVVGSGQAILSSLEELEDGILSTYFYPPHERLKLLLRAIDAAFSVPILMGLTTLHLFEQEKINFEATSHRDESFVLSIHELREQEKNARSLLDLVEKLRVYAGLKEE
jgi:hypothetical protein